MIKINQIFGFCGGLLSGGLLSVGCMGKQAKFLFLFFASCQFFVQYNEDGGGKKAVRVILLFGVVSLLADIAYKGARSVIGPMMFSFVAGREVVGIVVGLGEFLEYALRIFFGYVADSTNAYWHFTILGYAMIFSIPLMSFAGSWISFSAGYWQF